MAQHGLTKFLLRIKLQDPLCSTPESVLRLMTCVKIKAICCLWRTLLMPCQM